MSDAWRVLVVEDEESIAQVLVEVLASEEYDVRRAANGLDGLGILDAWTPHLIVLDLMMPVMDGRTFRHAQRRLDRGRGEIPVLVLSGAHEAHAIAEELAVAATITKPFEIDDLLRTVERLTRPPGEPAAAYTFE